MIKFIKRKIIKYNFNKALVLLKTQACAYICHDKYLLSICEKKIDDQLIYCKPIWDLMAEGQFIDTYHEFDDKWLNNNIDKLVSFLNNSKKRE